MSADARGHAPTGQSHSYCLRVFWEDTDAAGIVYYANYLRFIERARSELVRAAGIEQEAMLREAGVVVGVRHCAIDYLRPARLNDELTVRTSVERMGAATIDLLQEVWRGQEQLARAIVRLACFDRDGRPRRLPSPMRQALQGTFPQPAKA